MVERDIYFYYGNVIFNKLKTYITRMDETL